MTPFLFKIALTLHIIGFVVLAGIMLADFVAFRQFWKLVRRDAAKAGWLRKMVASFPPATGFIQISIIILYIQSIYLSLSSMYSKSI